MKNLICILALLCGLDLIALDSPKSSENPSLNSIYRTSSDSLNSIIMDGQKILYMSGDRAHIWSLVLKENNGFKIISGRIDEFGKNNFYEQTGSYVIDTIGFLSAYDEILSWGLDSLPTQSQTMKAVYRKGYWPFYTSLSIVRQDSTEFDSRDAIAFSGIDSVAFNKKFNNLTGIMRWLAQPQIRVYTPDSIYIRNL